MLCARRRCRCPFWDDRAVPVTCPCSISHLFLYIIYLSVFLWVSLREDGLSYIRLYVDQLSVVYLTVCSDIGILETLTISTRPMPRRLAPPPQGRLATTAINRKALPVTSTLVCTHLIELNHYNVSLNAYAPNCFF